MKLLLKIHKYFGLVTTLAMLLAATTGLLLMHGEALGLHKIAVRVPLRAVPGADAFDLLEVQGAVLMATRQGVFRRADGAWSLVLPANTKRFARVGGEVLAFGRDGLFGSRDRGRTWSLELAHGETRAVLDTPNGLVAAAQTGEFFGPWFFVLVDLTAVALIALSLSGLYIWYKPWMARRKARLRNAASASPTAAVKIPKEREAVGIRS